MARQARKEPPCFGERFELVAPLGTRWNGGVFLARDRTTGGEAAIKLLDESVVPEEAVHRFLAEARLLGALRHPHLVHALAWGRDHGFCWYGMELLPGGSLQELAKRVAVPPTHALALTFQLLLGLDALHRAGTVHRDVKLTNVLLAADGRAVLTDLGVAHHPEGSVPWDTHTGQSLGTEGYVAPEQFEDPAHVGPAADLFSSGVLLYRLVTRRPPHRVHLAQFRPEVLDEVVRPIREVIQRATRLDPYERYPSARAMAVAVAEAHDLVEGTAVAGTWTGELERPSGAPWVGVRAWLGS